MKPYCCTGRAATGGEDLQGFQNLVGLAGEALVIEEISGDK